MGICKKLICKKAIRIKDYAVSNATTPNNYKHNYVANIYNHAVSSAVVRYVPRIIVKIFNFSLWKWACLKLGMSHVVALILLLCLA